MAVIQCLCNVFIYARARARKRHFTISENFEDIAEFSRVLSSKGPVCRSRCKIHPDFTVGESCSCLAALSEPFLGATRAIPFTRRWWDCSGGVLHINNIYLPRDFQMRTSYVWVWVWWLAPFMISMCIRCKFFIVLISLTYIYIENSQVWIWRLISCDWSCLSK